MRTKSDFPRAGEVLSPHAVHLQRQGRVTGAALVTAITLQLGSHRGDTELRVVWSPTPAGGTLRS
ncbi:hypothetical protein H920_08944 [Fukomys damarensis]|uniref:Uncharacterized protein n=1 Tax=Fukomys damarensis TaxID=885580 RepID=A0A091DHC2_FUKDA|nr:hypothetical protein H920_08944 [Fukomys damarensis]